MSNNIFTACAVPACKCPTIEFVEKDRLLIRDDFKGEVTITTSEFEMMIDWYKRSAYDPKEIIGWIE